MEVKQLYELVNTISGEILGKTGIVAEDLSNVVDLGNEIFNANAVDNYVRKLVDHIGKMVFVNRPYMGKVPSVLKDGWEFGSVLEKIQVDMPDASENETWELIDGASYDPNIFYAPKVSVKFFNSKTTFEIPMSFTERQLKESFSNATQLNAFTSMLFNGVEKSLTVKVDSLIMRTINNMIGETLYADYSTTAYNAKSGIKAVNLLYLYNQANSTTLTAEQALVDTSFLKYASMKIGEYVDYLGSMSTLFNVGGKERFTPKELLHIVFLSKFQKSINAYLESDTFHNELVKLPTGYETVPYWQGSGVDYAFNNVSKIDITTSSGNAISTSGILAVMFDRDSLGVTNENRRVTSNYNAKAEFYTNFYKQESSYFNDLNENFVVFFVA